MVTLQSMLPAADRGRRQRPCRSAAATLAVLACALAPASARAADLAGVYRTVKPSVVYIVSALSDGVSSGSGFVYASSDTASLIVTASHVIEGASKIDVILDNDPKRRYQAAVVKRDHLHDIAELSIALGHRVPLKLQDTADTHEGMSVAAVGYPRAAKKFEQLMGDDLRPSIHAGIVSAIRLKGDLVQFDADTDHGDSGGPVIDVSTGTVVGVVRGSLLDQSYLTAGLETLPGSNFAASSALVARTFPDVAYGNDRVAVSDAVAATARTSVTLATSAVSKTSAGTASSGLVPGRPTAGAGSSSAEYRVGFATPHYDDPSVDAAAVRLAARLSEHFTKTNEVYAIAVLPGMIEGPTSKLATYCDDTRLNALMVPYVRLSAIVPGGDGTAAGRKVFVSVGIKITDCSGKPFFVGDKSSAQPIAFAARGQDRDVVDTLNHLLDETIAAFDRFKEAHQRAWTTLLKSGFALDPQSDRYDALFGFDQDSDSKEWRVSSVYADGPAARAGLQPGDTILAIDGKPTRGLSKAELDPLTNARLYTMTVLRPGGVTALRIESKKYAELQASLKR